MRTLAERRSSAAASVSRPSRYWAATSMRWVYPTTCSSVSRTRNARSLPGNSPAPRWRRWTAPSGRAVPSLTLALTWATTAPSTPAGPTRCSPPSSSRPGTTSAASSPWRRGWAVGTALATVALSPCAGADTSGRAWRDLSSTRRSWRGRARRSLGRTLRDPVADAPDARFGNALQGSPRRSRRRLRGDAAQDHHARREGRQPASPGCRDARRDGQFDRLAEPWRGGVLTGSRRIRSRNPYLHLRGGRYRRGVRLPLRANCRRRPHLRRRAEPLVSERGVRGTGVLCRSGLRGGGGCGMPRRRTQQTHSGQAH